MIAVLTAHPYAFTAVIFYLGVSLGILTVSLLRSAGGDR